jgi:hypothetical protein
MSLLDGMQLTRTAQTGITVILASEALVLGKYASECNIDILGMVVVVHECCQFDLRMAAPEQPSHHPIGSIESSFHQMYQSLPHFYVRTYRSEPWLTGRLSCGLCRITTMSLCTVSDWKPFLGFELPSMWPSVCWSIVSNVMRNT